jgi:hypothetical protein
MNNRDRQRRYRARQKNKERKTPTDKTQAEIAQYTCAIAALNGEDVGYDITAASYGPGKGVEY